MSSEKVDHIIKDIEIISNEDEAYFELGYEAFDMEYFLRANKQGTYLFAMELLKATQDFEMKRGKDTIISLNTGKWFVDNGVISPAIFVEHERRENIGDIEPYQETLKEKLVKAGCILVLVLCVFFFVIGIMASVDYLINELV